MKAWRKRPCAKHKRFQLECVDCMRMPVEEINKMTTEEIARVCHEANRAYCLSLGDTSFKPWDDAEEWQRATCIDGVVFHIEHLDRGEDPAPEASHNNWLKTKREDGWHWGPVKDAEKKQHPCMVHYIDLPLEQRRKDYLFAAIVKALYTAK